jgi:CRISPR-associated protein Csb2
MPGLMIGWEYLTGYAVATDPARRERAEWPPHPGRVFMALAAAWFETERKPDEGEALRWLETLGDPEVQLPPVDPRFERSAVTVYVPVNDKAGPAAAALQSHPAITRSKQPRTFPRIWVGDGACFMLWPRADAVDQHSEALHRLCGKVTRIGHSSSLVRMWVADDAVQPQTPRETWIADDLLADCQVRIVSTGTLDMLVERYGELPRQRSVELTEQIKVLEAQRKAAKGKGSAERKAVIGEHLGSLTQERDSTMARQPLRPTLGLWFGYRRRDRTPSSEDRASTHFDTDVLVLTHVDGPQLPLVSTQAVTRALRDTIMSNSGVQPVPAWISGHQSGGEPLASNDGHLACIPLPFVGRQHADGHLLGVGLVFPRAVDRSKRGQVLGKLLLDETGRSRHIELKLGRLGVWAVTKRDWTETRSALQPETWTGHLGGAETWASVTPVVVDRFPKADRAKDREAWTDEVAVIIVKACTRIGLPEPVCIDIDTTSWHRGSPRAVSKRRPLRGHGGAASDADAALGDGFPQFPAKGASASRPQVHVWLHFAEPVVGPVLLGAGRYLGYGLCKPWKEYRR